MPKVLGVVVACAMLATIARAASQPTASTFPGLLDEHPAIQYRTRPSNDPVAVFTNELAAGTKALRFDERGGYLQSLLTGLGVSPASQLLVFSKTGVQRAHTGPRNPRAIYFNDSVAVGYIPGAPRLELAAHDAEQGVAFYTIEQVATATPVITAGRSCLSCHITGATLDVPGMIVRSNFASADGGTMPQLGYHIVNHRTPIAHRWGGWFVTGHYTNAPYGGVTHMGNVVTSLHAPTGLSTNSNEPLIGWLNSSIASAGYPSPDSNVAALMVFDHQMHAINLLTRVNWEFRAAAHEGRLEVAADALRTLVNELADYLLFVGEAPPPARIEPPRAFVDQFVAKGPRDAKGRSLRELDLDRQLLRYPCSFMIYSPAFDRLPAAARDAVYRRLWRVLSGQETGRQYAHLSAADRAAIVEILRATKQDLPAIFKK